MNSIKIKFLNQSGMTLLEIIIVVVIVSVLALTISVQYINFSDSAKLAACQANRDALRTGITTYWAIHLEYPEEIDDLAEYMRNGAIPECPSGGVYELVDNSDVICSLSKHQ
ncbi:prepilin-type N-terminal cleavage/methylation domain-containing protein [bacterium]|nr:prepilin-type N-terminal cleavage/methylation domain-containing protein [bacterium]